MSAIDPHRLLDRAAAIVRGGMTETLSEFDTEPIPIYATDADGVITYYNPACVEFAGHAALVGEDRWCVSWKLFTEDGDALPHDQCPMAVALREGREVRGQIAVAERPDGQRRRFMPYPTPVRDDLGRLLGAINLFAEAKAAPTAANLRAQARRWRRVALSVDPQTAEALEAHGRQLESEAKALDPEG